MSIKDQINEKFPGLGDHLHKRVVEMGKSKSMVEASHKLTSLEEELIKCKWTEDPVGNWTIVC